MEYLPRLERLMLLVTLFLGSSFIRAEGTLPIPVSSEELPLTLNGEAVASDNMRRNDMEVSVDRATDNLGVQLKSRCRGQESFYPAGGRIVLGTESFQIRGLCAAGGSNQGQRQIIAVRGSELVQLDGVLSGIPATTFNGTMKREAMAVPRGEAQQFRFDLTRSGF